MCPAASWETSTRSEPEIFGCLWKSSADAPVPNNNPPPPILKKSAKIPRGENKNPGVFIRNPGDLLVPKSMYYQVLLGIRAVILEYLPAHFLKKRYGVR